MTYGFRNGSAEAIRLAKLHADANGLGGLRCVDAWPYHQPLETLRNRGLIRWTVRFDGLPPGPFDDGSVVILVDLESGEAKRLGAHGPRPGELTEDR